MRRVEVISRRRIFDDFFKIEEARLRFVHAVKVKPDFVGVTV